MIAMALDSARQSLAVALIPSIASGNVDKIQLGDIIRISYALLLPVNAIFFFFPKPVLKLINPEYLVATNPLRIYMLSNMILLMTGLLLTHIYATGNYKYTLLVNTSMSTARVALYTILTPVYGATGSAIAFLAGTLVATSLLIPKIHGVKAPWSKMTLSLTISISLGVVLEHLIDGPTLAIVAIAIMYLLIIYLLHIMIKLMKKNELLQLLEILKTIAKGK